MYWVLNSVVSFYLNVFCRTLLYFLAAYIYAYMYNIYISLPAIVSVYTVVHLYKYINTFTPCYIFYRRFYIYKMHKINSSILWTKALYTHHLLESWRYYIYTVTHAPIIHPHHSGYKRRKFIEIKLIWKLAISLCKLTEYNKKEQYENPYFTYLNNIPWEILIL